MLGFLYKELFTMRYHLLFSFLFSTVLMASSQFINADNVFEYLLGQGVTVILAFVISNAVYDQSFQGDEGGNFLDFAASAPCSLRGHLAAKYLFILAANTMLLFICAAVEFIARDIFSINDSALSSVGIVILAICLIMSALNFPFVVRFGSGKGNTVALIVLLLIVFGAIVYFLFGDISFLFTRNSAEHIIKFFTDGSSQRILLIIIFLSVPIYLLSYIIALPLYKKGIEKIRG